MEILIGKDAGKQGLVNQVIRARNWVFVEGLNTVREGRGNLQSPVCWPAGIGTALLCVIGPMLPKGILLCFRRQGPELSAQEDLSSIPTTAQGVLSLWHVMPQEPREGLCREPVPSPDR